MGLGCALAWAIAVLLFRRLSSVSPVALNLFKNTTASLLLLLTMWAFGIPIQWHRPPAEWGELIASGVLGLALADTLFFAGLRRIDASVVAATDCAYAPAVILLSWLFLREPLTRGTLIGAPLVVAGLYGATVWSPKRGRERASEQATGGVKPVDRAGVALAVSGVIMTAVGILVAKPALARAHMVEATAIRLVSGTVTLAIVQVIRAHMLSQPMGAAFALFRPQRLWRFAVPATLSGTYVSMLLWIGGMKYGAPSRVALLNQLAAIFVLIFSRLSGEVVPWTRWLGVGVAVLGAVCVMRL